jgi:hypothetical protein
VNIIKAKIVFAFLLLSACASTKTKVSGGGFSMNEVTLEDSIINKYFESYYPDITLRHDTDTIKGKAVVLTNYYEYYSFKKIFEDTDSITIVNFGSYTSHTRSFMLLTHKTNAKKEQIFLGGGSYNDELHSLNDFFQSLGGKVPEEDKILITDLFLRCRRGQAQTPTYVKY